MTMNNGQVERVLERKCQVRDCPCLISFDDVGRIVVCRCCNGQGKCDSQLNGYIIEEIDAYRMRMNTKGEDDER